MKSLLKWSAIVVGVVVLFFVAAAILVPLFFDPNDYKQALVEQVKEQTGRDLRIDGDDSIPLEWGRRVEGGLGERIGERPLEVTIRVDRRAHFQVVLDDALVADEHDAGTLQVRVGPEARHQPAGAREGRVQHHDVGLEATGDEADLEPVAYALHLDARVSGEGVQKRLRLRPG